MSTTLKVYRLKDFIRVSANGAIDLGRSKEIVYKPAIPASFHKDHNILVDLRGSAEQHTIGDYMELALELARYKSAFTGKVAFIVPTDPDRLFSAKQLIACMDAVDYQFQCEIFTSFEDAIDWSSDTIDASRRRDPLVCW
jgi:hypothetical protein